LRKALQFKYS